MNLDRTFDRPFIWRKKYEAQGIEIDEKAILLEVQQQIEENRIELEHIKERRRKRDLEKQQKTSESELLARQREAELHDHWEQGDDNFVLSQNRRRSKIRIRNGRAKPIDRLTHYIDTFGEKPDLKKSTALIEDEIDLSDLAGDLCRNPCDWLNGLNRSDLEALLPDIKTYLSIDCDANKSFWKDLHEISQNELSKLQIAEDQATSGVVGADEINSSVLQEVLSLFEDKSIAELDELEEQMNAVLKDDDPSIDVEYYKNAILRLRAYRAKLRLTLNHKENLRLHMHKIFEPTESKPVAAAPDDDQKEEMSIDGDKKAVEDEPVTGGRNDDQEVESEKGEQVEDDLDIDEIQALAKRPTESKPWCMVEYENGNYSPEKLSPSQLEPGTTCVDFPNEFKLLTQQRHQMCNATSVDEAKKITMSRDERAFLEAAKEGMNNKEDSTFSCEAEVRGPNNRAQTYIWADRYQPRKPRYFNRVHTGFEWNKYNQTHYDIDNPPPKVVQGYKFNIFYPDLIDKTQTPTFKLTPCEDDRDFCTIRFSAGPPYEDIAFRIVNREWNTKGRSGYRCQFSNSMLQLWFQFRRDRYRR